MFSWLLGGQQQHVPPAAAAAAAASTAPATSTAHTPTAATDNTLPAADKKSRGPYFCNKCMLLLKEVRLKSEHGKLGCPARGIGGYEAREKEANAQMGRSAGAHFDGPSFILHRKDWISISENAREALGMK